jgi:hypothetical protein
MRCMITNLEPKVSGDQLKPFTEQALTPASSFVVTCVLDERSLVSIEKHLVFVLQRRQVENVIVARHGIIILFILFVFAVCNFCCFPLARPCISGMRKLRGSLKWLEKRAGRWRYDGLIAWWLLDWREDLGGSSSHWVRVSYWYAKGQLAQTMVLDHERNGFSVSISPI